MKNHLMALEEYVKAWDNDTVHVVDISLIMNNI